MGEQINASHFGRKGGIGQVSEAEALSFHQDFDHIRRSAEIEDRSSARLGWGRTAVAGDAGNVQFSELAPRQLRWLGLPVLPAVHGSVRNAQKASQRLLRQAEPGAQPLDLN
jgi:hypothetical protein